VQLVDQQGIGDRVALAGGHVEVRIERVGQIAAFGFLERERTFVGDAAVLDETIGLIEQCFDPRHDA
jgi:hypothetical protein